jgi:type VI protein secretion system component Hcp
MALDGFMYLKGGGRTAITGETKDEKFSDKDAMSIHKFELSSPASVAEVAASKEQEEEDEEEDETPVRGGTSADKHQSGKDAKANKDKDKKKDKETKKKRAQWSFEISKDVDNATPLLFKAYCEHAQEQDPEPYTAKLVLRKAGGKWSMNYLELTFYDVQVISFEIKSEGDKLPKEKVAFSFRKCKFRYSAQKPDGGARPNEKTFDWRLLQEQS